MPAQFDRHEADYLRAVEQAVGFAGQPHDVYIEVKVRKLLELARRRLGDEQVTALDVGCGPGLVARHLSGHVASLHGVDVSEGMVARARERVPEAEFRVSGAEHLPYEDDDFDLVFTVCVLHHVKPDVRVILLREMGRVARPGGVVAVFEHNPWNPLTRKVVRGCDFDEGVELLSRRDVVRELTQAGLEITDMEYLLFSPWRSTFVDRMERTLTWCPLGAQHVVAAHLAG
jgi:SAM-dependent methyltransferase